MRPGFIKLPRLRAPQAFATLLAACITLGLGLPTTSGSAFSLIPDEVEHHAGHHCACKSCRGNASCCCAKGEAHSTSKTPDPSRNFPESGPCFNTVPCGEGHGLPPNRPGSPVSKATLAEPIVVRHGCLLPSLLPSPEPFVPASFVDRLDDPPQRS